MSNMTSPSDVDIIIPKRSKFERLGSEYNLETDGSIHLNNKFNIDRWQTFNQGTGLWEDALLREDPKINRQEMFNMRMNRWEVIPPKTPSSGEYKVDLNTANAIEMLLFRIYSNTHIKQVDIRTIIISIIIFTVFILILLVGFGIYSYLENQKQKKELQSLKKELDEKVNIVK
jgi:hypothetical protein